MRILFITWTRLGDVVLSTGLIEHLQAACPGARITVACGPVAERLFGACPAVEKVLPIVKQRRGGHWVALWRAVVGTGWDLVIDLRNSAVSRLILARRRVIKQGGSAPVQKPVELGRLMRLDAPPDPTVWLPQAAIDKAARLLPGDQPTLMVSPAAQWIAKTWPAENYVEAALALTGEDGILAGARVAVMASATERDQATPVLAGLASQRETVDLIGNTDVVEAAACFRRCRLFLGNDTGLMHLAAAAGTPTLGLFGPTDETIYAPWGDHAGAIRSPEPVEQLRADPRWRIDGSESLLTGLDVDSVVWAASTLLRTQVS